ncbi:MAG TPA: methyl-accepting chemotaxis protein [Baekduia sp.]|nr:methyl-accepting chemotaxis protein [Baekduia sp.]
MRLTLARKIGGGFAAVIVLLLVALAVGWHGVSTLDDRTHVMAEQVVPAVEAVGDVAAGAHAYRAAQLEPGSASRGESAGAAERLGAAAQRVDRAIAAAARLAATPAERSGAARAAADWRAYRDGAAGGAQAYARVIADTARWNALVRQRAARAAQASEQLASATRTRLLLALLTAIAVAVAAATIIGRSVRRHAGVVLDRLRSLRDHCATALDEGLGALAAGDLTRDIQPVTPPIERRSNDEIGAIASATNGIRERFVAMIAAYNASRAALGEMIGEVASTAGHVSAASRQVAATSAETGRAVGDIAAAIGDAAGGAERQVLTIGETRRLVDEVVAVTGRAADDAATTERAAEDARRVAGEGAAAAGGATRAMASVREASEAATAAIRSLGTTSAEIGGIVDTITGIAEQTNLLALNAAIEAARAGEHGRGFAVVAEEVRQLAEGSQVAARSIASLIASIQAETARAVEVVEDGARRTIEGTTVVEEARGAFERIGGSVDDVTDRVAAIAAAVEQIAASAQRMGERMGEVAAVAEQASAGSQQMSATTQQTSAATQQIAASAQELAASASRLDDLVGRFTLAQG